MKIFGQLILCCALFSTLLVTGKGGVIADYPDSLRSVYLYTEGIKYNLIYRDTIKADSCYREAINIDSTYAPAYFKLAWTKLYDNSPYAMEMSKKAYDLDSTNKWYLDLYGRTLLTNRKYTEARYIYHSLNKLQPQDPTNYSILASLYDHAQLPLAAIAILDSAEVRCGQIPQFTDMKRRLLIATKQYGKAIEEAKKAVDLIPYNIDNHIILGELYGIAGKDSLAVIEFNNAMEIDSTNLELLTSFSKLYGSKGDYNNFLRIYKKIFNSSSIDVNEKISRFEVLILDKNFYKNYYSQLNYLISILMLKHPGDGRVVKLYATHLVASGEIESALVQYKHHLTVEPQYREFYKDVIEIESYLKRQDSVSLYINKALNIFPDDSEFKIFNGHILSGEKSYAKAIKVYKDALKFTVNDVDNSAIWGYIGDVYYADDKLKKCYKAYDKALELNGDNSAVLNNYAYFLSIITYPLTEDTATINRAIDMAEKATLIMQNNSTYLDTYAWALYMAKRFDEARKVMRQAISFDRGNSTELLMHYGDILAALNEDFLAEIYWQKAVDNGYSEEVVKNRILNLKTQKK